MNDKNEYLNALQKFSYILKNNEERLVTKKILAEMVRDRSFGKIVVSWAIEYVRKYIK